ncbi:origin recognition complex subunit 4 C-terminus-domain-containing protein [Mycena crocata]|nr:origin recognition complex subunit 4 C-terminus-domain-containing protein [Mycena crocata]
MFGPRATRSTSSRSPTKPLPGKASDEGLFGPPSSPTKRIRRSASSRFHTKPRVEDSDDDIPSPARSPSKRATRSVPSLSPNKPPPTKASPAKKRRRSPSPVPDSEPESRDPSPPVASPSRWASSVQSREEQKAPPPTATIHYSPSKTAHHLPSISSQHCLNAQKREVLYAVQCPPDIIDEEDDSTNSTAFKQLADLLKGTVIRGEGNSCLLIGPRGSGKTRIADQCISNLLERPIIIRLCGWSQQSDRLAMREIAYQLSQQTGKSFLAAPDEAMPEMELVDDEPNPFLDTSNPVTMSLPPSSHLPALISLLPTLARPTVVILDGFDLFAQHPRQSLLYCLLDTVQSCRAGAGSKGIAVIGMTTRIDTINLLEKRVKSRFSGRMLRTAPPSQSQDWMKLARRILGSRIKTNRELDEIDGWQQRWEDGVRAFLDDEVTISVLKETFSVTKDVRALARLLTSVAIQLSPSSPFPTSAQLVSAIATQRTRDRFPLLHTLPYPSLCLLIACVHAETAGQPTFTFEMIHEKVRDQIRASTSAPVEFNGNSIGMAKCSRPAFEALVSARILAPAAAPSANVAKEFIKFRAVVARVEVKKAVQTKNDMNLTRWLTKATQ